MEIQKKWNFVFYPWANIFQWHPWALNLEDYYNLFRKFYFDQVLGFAHCTLLIPDDRILQKQYKFWRVKERIRSCRFLRIFIYTDGLFYVSLGYVRVNECPAGLEPTAGARNWRKATVKMLKKPATSDSFLDPFVIQLLITHSLHLHLYFSIISMWIIRNQK